MISVLRNSGRRSVNHVTVTTTTAAVTSGQTLEKKLEGIFLVDPFEFEIFTPIGQLIDSSGELPGCANGAH